MTYDWNDMKSKLDTAIKTGIGLEDAWNEWEAWNMKRHSHRRHRPNRWERIDRQLFKAIEDFHYGKPLSPREAQMMIYAINQVTHLCGEYGPDLHDLIQRSIRK